MPSLRDRKRARTRQALADAAAELFLRDGYEQTTIADIAAAADVSPRTFFSYFASKEEVLFVDGGARVQAALAAIDERGPGETPTGVLLRALREVSLTHDDLIGPTASLRLQLIRTVPAVRGRALQVQQDAAGRIARRLRDAFPDDLDDVESAALVGAFIGAISGALQVLVGDGSAAEVGADVDALRDRLNRAIAVALRPWTT